MTRHDMGGGSMGIPKIHAGLLFSAAGDQQAKVPL